MKRSIKNKVVEKPTDGVCYPLFGRIGRHGKQGQIIADKGKSLPMKIQLSASDNVFVIDIPDKHNAVVVRFDEVYTAIQQGVSKYMDLIQNERTDENKAVTDDSAINESEDKVIECTDKKI